MSTVDPSTYYGRCDSLDEKYRPYCREYIDQCVEQRRTRGQYDSSYELVSVSGKKSTGLKFIDCLQLSPIYALHGKPKAEGLPNTKVTDPCNTSQPVYKEGMLVFQSLSAEISLVRVIQDATDSTITHVGILHKNENEKWVVIESFGNNGEETPINVFLARSNGVAWYKEIVGLSADDAREFVNKAIDLTKEQPKYDAEFEYGNGKLYCSELVGLAANAIDIKLFDTDVRASWFDTNDESVRRYLGSLTPPRNLEAWRILPPHTLFYSNKLKDPDFICNSTQNAPCGPSPNHELYDTLPGRKPEDKIDNLWNRWGKHANLIETRKEIIDAHYRYLFKLNIDGTEYGLILFGQFPEEEQLAQEILKRVKRK